MSRPFCEVRCTFVRCLFMGSTYIWQYSSWSLLYVVFRALALRFCEWLHAEELKICIDFFFFFKQNRKPDCLIKQGFVNVLSHVSFEGIFCGVAKHGCVFSFFLFFSLHVWQQIWSCTYARECTTCQLHCTWKMNLGGAAGILLDWLGCVRAF